MILFKDQHVRNDIVNMQMLEGLINNIAFTTRYWLGTTSSTGKPTSKPRGR